MSEMDYENKKIALLKFEVEVKRKRIAVNMW